MFKKILVGVMALTLLATSAYATVTVSSVKHTSWGDKRVTYGYITITGAPASAGYAVTARKLGLTMIERVILYPDASYPDVSWTYTGGTSGAISSSGYLVPMRGGWLDRKQVVLAGTGDSIKVTQMRGDGFATQDAETTICFVSPFSGNLARFHVQLPTVATGAAATTGLQDNIFAATDGVTLGSVADTGLTTGGPILRATNTTAGWYHGDTLYFLPNATDITARLAYSGRTTLGASIAATYANLYVPFGLGNYIKVVKKSGAELYAANAIPVYYVRDGALGSKFVANQYVAATAIRGGKHAGTPIVVDRVPTTTAGFTTVLYFMAIGN